MCPERFTHANATGNQDRTPAVVKWIGMVIAFVSNLLHVRLGKHNLTHDRSLRSLLLPLQSKLMGVPVVDDCVITRRVEYILSLRSNCAGFGEMRRIR